MSGGGGSKKKSSSSDKAKTEAIPAYLGGGVNSTFPQAMPNQLEAIAAQLSAGYGAPQAQNMAFLDNLYSPMSVPMKPAPGPSSGGGSGGAGLSPRDEIRDRLIAMGIEPGYRLTGGRR